MEQSLEAYRRLTWIVESPTGLVTLVVIQYLAAEIPQYHNEDILPTEMDRQVRYACLARRADTGEEVEAPIQEKHPCRCSHGPQLPGQV